MSDPAVAVRDTGARAHARSSAAAPAVSVVVATYNREALLRQALDSVARQTFDDWECLVCDDGSTDGTLGLIAEFAGRDGRFRLAAGPRFGYPAGPRNRGVREARGAWIAFLDDDDVWHPEKLARQMQIAADGHCDAVSAPSRPVAPHELPSFDDPPSAYTARPLGLAHVLLQRQPFPATPANLIRRDRLLACGGFVESAAYRATEDYELWCRLLATPAFVWEMPEGATLVRWREAGGDSISNWLDPVRPDVIRQRWSLLETLSRFATSPLLSAAERGEVLAAVLARSDDCAHLSRLAGWRSASVVGYLIAALAAVRAGNLVQSALRLVRVVRFALLGAAARPGERPAAVMPLARAALRNTVRLLLGGGQPAVRPAG